MRKLLLMLRQGLLLLKMLRPLLLGPKPYHESSCLDCTAKTRNDVAVVSASLAVMKHNLRMRCFVNYSKDAAIVRVSVRCRVRTLSTSGHSKAKAK